MASNSYRQWQDQVKGMVGEAKLLTVDKLKHVLRQEGLTVSGIKSELQIRIIAHIEKNASDPTKLERIRSLIRGMPTYNSNSNPYPSPYSNHTPASSASPQFSSPLPRISTTSTAYNMGPSRPFSSPRLAFRNSPFYTISRPLSDVVEVKARETTRDTARVTVQLTQDVADLLQRDKNARVMVFCAAENYQAMSRESEIAFPHQVELKCNQDDVKANLRGLKNKPGSTRPADITSFLRKKAGYPNAVEMVYALTTKTSSTEQKFFLVVNLVMKRPIETLIAELRRGKFISKEQVLREMQSKASDTDIVATSSVMSLKCPLSFTRIITPSRSIACSHNQCFDATSYLQLQEQAPTWTCPVCNKSATWENLVIDQYVDDILNSTSKSIEQVTVEPEGSWYAQGDNRNGNNNPTPSDDGEDEDADDDDDDLIEVSNLQPLSSISRNSQVFTPTSMRTPPAQSREQSTAASTSRSNKRTREEVIDLTLSDDDDDPQPAAKVKRPSMSSNDSRVRPPDRYHFDLPTLNPSNFDFNRLSGNFY